MILYLDTSSLVKLYIEEDNSNRVAELAESAEGAATSIVAYAEARAAFARKHRENALNRRDYRRLVTSFNEDWESYLIVQIREEIVRAAGDLAEKHGLRGFDAIHLSSAMALRNALKTPIVFSCADQRLNDASRSEGFRLP